VDAEEIPHIQNLLDTVGRPFRNEGIPGRLSFDIEVDSEPWARYRNRLQRLQAGAEEICCRTLQVHGRGEEGANARFGRRGRLGARTSVPTISGGKLGRSLRGVRHRHRHPPEKQKLIFEAFSRPMLAPAGSMEARPGAGHQTRACKHAGRGNSSGKAPPAKRNYVTLHDPLK